MEELTDSQLLERYVSESEESAFSEIVRRRLPLVFGTALRRLGGDRSAAQDVAQGVFVALARQGKSLVRHPALAAWLYSTTLNQAADHLRRQLRRQSHQQSLMTHAEPTSPGEVDWARLQPVLDDALQELNEEDRHAVVLRYMEQRAFASIGRELGLSDDAARMRTSRALEKLRSKLAKRGVVSAAAALEAVLLAQPAVEVPSGLAPSIQAAVQQLAGAAVPGSILSTPVWKATAALLTLLAAAGSIHLWHSGQKPPNHSTFSSRAAALGAGGTNRAHARLPFGRAPSRRGTSMNATLERGLSYLRSALFDHTLSDQKRFALSVESAGLLVGYENEALPLFRDALTSRDAKTVRMAIATLGRFGPAVPEFAKEYLALLAKPEFKEDAGLIANRLLFALQNLDRAVPLLIDLFRNRPDLQEQMEYLLTAALQFDAGRLAENRDKVAALLNDANVDVQDAARKILTEAPQPPPPLTADIVDRLTTQLRAPNAEQRQSALAEIRNLNRLAPAVREVLADSLQHDESAQLRIEARQLLQKLAPEDPVLSNPPRDEANRSAFLARLNRNEIPVPEMLNSLADRPRDISEICQSLGRLGSAYWIAHPELKISAIQCLATLHNNRDAQVFEAASDALASMDAFRPRSFYRFEELQPLFDTMEAYLKPGEYAIAMRDLRPGVESYWRLHGFIQPEPTHMPASDVNILLAGPYYQNRAAYEAMTQALQQIDPKFRPHVP